MKFELLYKGITLTVQDKFTNCIRVYNIAFCQGFQMILKNSFIFFTQRFFSPLKFSHSRIVSNFIFKFHHQNFVIAEFSTIFLVKFYPNESIFKIIIIFIKFFTKIIFKFFLIYLYSFI